MKNDAVADETRLTDFFERVARLEPDPLCPELRAYNARNFRELSRFAREHLPESRGVPFWGLVWPGSRALGRLLLDRRCDPRGLRVLDLGCGSGLAGIAAARAGGRVTGIDLDPLSVQVATRTAEINAVGCDWVKGDGLVLSERELAEFDMILVGDMLYDPDLAGRTLSFLAGAIAGGPRVLIADPDRAGERLRGRSDLRVLQRMRVPVLPELENVPYRDVTIYCVEPSIEPEIKLK